MSDVNTNIVWTLKDNVSAGTVKLKKELAGVGVNMVIYPVTLLRSAMCAAERTLESIKADGTQEAQVGSMLTRARLYDLVDYEAYNRFDTGVFNFQIPGK